MTLTQLGVNAYVHPEMTDDADEKITRERDQTFATNLDAILTARDLTARSIAKKVEIGDAELSRYRTGKVVPPVSTAAKIARALQVSLDELMRPLPEKAKLRKPASSDRSAGQLLPGDRGKQAPCGDTPQRRSTDRPTPPE